MLPGCPSPQCHHTSKTPMGTSSHMHGPPRPLTSLRNSGCIHRSKRIHTWEEGEAQFANKGMGGGGRNKQRRFYSHPPAIPFPW